MAWKSKKEEEKPKKGPPPKGCDFCRGKGSFSESLVEHIGEHRRVTDYGCRCTCALGADMFRGLPTLDGFRRMHTGEVLIEPTPRERAGKMPMTLDECEAESVRMLALLAKAPAWQLGERVPT